MIHLVVNEALLFNIYTRALHERVGVGVGVGVGGRYLAHGLEGAAKRKRCPNDIYVIV